MSLPELFSSFLVNRTTQNLGNQEFDLHSLILGMAELTKGIKKLADLTPQPWIFLKGTTGLSSNVAANVEIYTGAQVPQGYRATIKDFNLIYSTQAGAVRIVIADAQKQIIQPLLSNINATINGIGETVLEQNQRLMVVGETAGLGTFTVYCSGILQKITSLEVN